MDRAVRAEPHASGQSRLPYRRHSDDRALGPALCRLALRARALALWARALRRRLDLPVRRPLLREEAARVLDRLALPLRRPALVVCQAAGTCLKAAVLIALG